MEKRTMEWLQSNWIWIALGLAFLAMHMFGHGGHGHSHGSHSRSGRRDQDRPNDTTAARNAEYAHADRTTPRATNSNDPELPSTPVHAGHNATVKETR